MHLLFLAFSIEMKGTVNALITLGLSEVFPYLLEKSKFLKEKYTGSEIFKIIIIKWENLDEIM